jgi:putative hemolysin
MVFAIIILLIILNGYFSLAEIALVSVNDTDLAGELGNPKASQVMQLIKDPEEFLSAVQVGITLLGLLEGIYGGSIAAGQLESWFIKTGMSNLTAHILSLVTGIGIITYLTIVFGELVPKSIALQMPLRVSLAIAPSLRLFSQILFPFIKILTASTRLILSSFSIKHANNKKITEKDLKRILGAAYQQGTLGKQELWMHENVFSFNYLRARSIMKPARIIVCLSYDWPREQVVEMIRKRPYSNFPVYKNEPGNIVGIINTKDFFLNETASWQQIIKFNCSVPEDMTTKDIFNTFREKKLDFGVVTGEAKQFLGILAMQDIMEAVFGDLPEREDYSPYLFVIAEKVWMAEDFIHLQYIRIQLSLPWIRAFESTYVNLAEFMTGESQGKKAFIKSGTTFEVMSKDKNGNSKIKITLP